MHEQGSLRASGLAVMALWLCAFVVSLLGYYDRWNAVPSMTESLIGTVLLSGFALPLSFAQTLGAKIPLENVMFLAAAYWPVFGFAHYQFLRRRRPQLFGALVILVALSAWRWQINVQGMMGI